ncbi:MAG: DUF3467 domain-containing protein [Deltaproteobacteria bacterium]|nr:MAG: DUF3467 domain-containing protein [Deltaproteobacteria bacterium]
MTVNRDQETGERTESLTTPRVRWDTVQLKSYYANVCNVTTTREEVVLNFGINHTWERSQQEVEIQLTNRIILSPFTAKRLMVLLSSLINEYESRYGEIKLDITSEGSTVTQ